MSDLNTSYAAQTPPSHAIAPPDVDSPLTGGSNPVSPRDRKISQPAGLNARSCVTCRRRKVKCDKCVPCSNCTKAHTECIFPAPGRAPRRPREGAKPVSEREALLLKRLRRLEGVVEELSGQTSSEYFPRHVESGNEPHNTGVRVVGMDEGSKTTTISGQQKSTTRLDGALGALTLDEGRSQYVAHPFWAAITEEVEEMREILGDGDFPSDDEHSSSHPSPQTVVNDTSHQSFIMGYSSSNVNLKRLHPLPSQIPFYWQKYIENVDPLVKITHTPTMNKVIREVQSKLDSLSAGTEALMFSIYFATIISMDSEDVRNDLGQDKDQLLKQYRFGIEQALARANFLNTNEIVTVQALVIFLICVRRLDDTRFVWSMTALALRIAQSLGLHRDGTKFGLSPFDTEMRRRLWWSLCVLDVRAAEDHASEPSIIDHTFDTELPLNIDDCELDPEATEAPVPKSELSEMTFCLIRFEICTLVKKLNLFSDSKISCPKIRPQLAVEDKERMIQEFAVRLEENYLKYSQDGGPAIHWVAATIGRLITARMRLMIYQAWSRPGEPNALSQPLRDSLFMSSIEILEYTHILKSEPSTKQWRWLFHTYTQWYCIAYLLGELAIRDTSITVDRAWRTIDREIQDWSSVLSKTNPGMLWKPMLILMARARRRREENASKPAAPRVLGMDVPVPPPTGRKAPPSEEELRAREIFLAQMNQAVRPPNDMQFTNASTTSCIGAEMPGAQNVEMFSAPMMEPMPEMPWLMGGDALTDLDVQGDVNWDGWQDLVRDFQMDTDNIPAGDASSVPLGAMQTWW